MTIIQKSQKITTKNANNLCNWLDFYITNVTRLLNLYYNLMNTIDNKEKKVKIVIQERKAKNGK